MEIHKRIRWNQHNPNVIKRKLWQCTTLEERSAKKSETPKREPNQKCTREKKHKNKRYHDTY